MISFPSLANDPTLSFVTQVSILLWAEDRLRDLAPVPVHKGLQRALPQVRPSDPVQQRESESPIEESLCSIVHGKLSVCHRLTVAFALLQEIDEYIAQAKDRSYETMMRFGKRSLNLAANAAVTAATKVSNWVAYFACDHLKERARLANQNENVLWLWMSGW